MDTVIRVPLLLIWLSAISARLRESARAERPSTRETRGEGNRESETRMTSDKDAQRSNE